jgi:hypothetical protein
MWRFRARLMPHLLQTYSLVLFSILDHRSACPLLSAPRVHNAPRKFQSSPLAFTSERISPFSSLCFVPRAVFSIPYFSSPMRGGYPPLCDVSFAAGSSTWLSFSVPAVFFRSVFFLYSLYLITIVFCLSSDPQSPTVPSFFCWRAMIQTRVTPLSVRCLVDVVNVPSIPFSLSFLTQPCLWLLTVILLFRSLSRFYQFHDSPRLCEVDTRRSVMIRSPLDPPHGYLFLTSFIPTSFLPSKLIFSILVSLLYLFLDSSSVVNPLPPFYFQALPWRETMT